MKRSSLLSGKILLLAVLILLVVCFIFANSMLDGATSCGMSSGLSAWLKAILDPGNYFSPRTFHVILRKSAHFCEFGVLAVVLVAFVNEIRKCGRELTRLFPAFFCLATAVCDEFIQSFTGRTSSVCDVVLDFCGALTGMVLAVLFHLIFVKRQSLPTKPGK